MNNGTKNPEWFQRHMDMLNAGVIKPKRADGLMYACPCCGFKTLSERGGFEVCEVCYWEDDGQDDRDADVERGGANGLLSLSQARKNYQDYGACDKDALYFVRSPRGHE